MEELAGKKLGKYQLLEKLGEGGMAVVYKAYQPNLDRFVAIKILHPHLSNQPGFLKRFEREAKSIAALHHPNIIQVYDYDHEQNLTYFVMEYIEGTTLTRALENRLYLDKEISLKDAVQWVVEIGRALAYAHQQGVIHRDIKPDNVLLDHQGRAILTDFGIAKLLHHDSDITLTGAFIGTPAYVSPEQAKGERGDARSDIYSLGVLFFELVTGKLPFTAENPMGLAMQHITTPPPIPRQGNPNIPEALEKIILKALEKSPENRYQSANELVEDLSRVIATIDPAALEQPTGIDEEPAREPEFRPDALGAESQIAPQISQPASSRSPADRARRRSRSLAWIAVAGIVGIILVFFSLREKPLSRSLFGDLPPAPRATTPATTLFEDDFSDPSSGWDRSRDANGITDYDHGVYRILVQVTDNNFYSLPGLSFHNVRITVDATKVGGPDENTFGVICGYRSPQDFYYLIITSDGLYGIGKMENGIPVLIGQESLAPAESISKGETTNHIQAECNENSISLTVNGSLLTSTPPAGPTEGEFGLIAGTSSLPGTNIEFDNFVASSP